MKWYLKVGFTVLVMVTTLLIRIPVPGGGYFNFGDVVIVFAALLGGSRSAALAGGIGSALADLIGFPIFAPITLVAKGLLGLLAGLGKDKPTLLSMLFPVLGGMAMVAVYFLGSWLMPSLGFAAALADLPANLLQSAFGITGGRLLFTAWQRLESVRTEK